MRGLAAALVLLETVMCSAETRDAFLARVDAALAAHDAKAILALSDVGSWTESGRPKPDPAAIVLPDAAVSRVRDLSETDILYAEPGGRQWRLSLRGDAEHGWKVVLRDRACPAIGGMARGLEFERPAPPSTPGSWAPLECWPLPR